MDPSACWMTPRCHSRHALEAKPSPLSPSTALRPAMMAHPPATASWFHKISAMAQLSSSAIVAAWGTALQSSAHEVPVLEYLLRSSSALYLKCAPIGSHLRPHDAHEFRRAKQSRI